MGIFWSMVPAPGQRDGARLIKKDVNTPLTTKVTVYNGHLAVNTIHSAETKPLCTVSIDRWYMGLGVRRVIVKHGRIRGVLFLPAGKLSRFFLQMKASELKVVFQDSTLLMRFPLPFFDNCWAAEQSDNVVRGKRFSLEYPLASGTRFFERM